MPHPGLSSQVHDAHETFARKKFRQCKAVGEFKLHESKAWIPLQPFQAGGLQGRIIVGVEVVEADHFIAALEEAQRRVVTDKAGRTGDESLHFLEPSVCGIALEEVLYVVDNVFRLGEAPDAL